MKYTMADVGVRVSPATMIDFLNDQRRGGYGYIHGYCSGTGEVANHYFKAACIYPNLLARSIAALDDGSLMGHIIEHGLEVHRGTWAETTKGPDGNATTTYHNRKAIGRVHQKIDKTYSMKDINDAAMILEAMAAVRKGLADPKKVDQGFTGIAKGTYTKEDEAPGVIYFRDCLEVSKTVTQQEEIKQTASDELPAVKETIRRMLPVSRYRAYRLASNFEYISLGGLALIQGANLGAWDLRLAEKDSVKEPVAVPVAGAAGDTWNQES